jgi:hypothetical protein
VARLHEPSRTSDFRANSIALTPKSFNRPISKLPYYYLGTGYPHVWATWILCTLTESVAISAASSQLIPHRLLVTVAFSQTLDQQRIQQPEREDSRPSTEQQRHVAVADTAVDQRFGHCRCRPHHHTHTYRFRTFTAFRNTSCQYHRPNISLLE